MLTLSAPNPLIWGSSKFAWLCRLLLSAVLASFALAAPGRMRWARIVAGWTVLAAGILGILTFSDADRPLYLAPLSSITFVCLALAILLLETRHERALAVVPWLALTGVVFNSVALLGYVYRASQLYGGTVGAVGICSALAFILLGTGFLFAAGTRRAPIRLLFGKRISAQLLRSLLPVTFGAMLLGQIVSDLLRGEGMRSLTVQDALQTFFATAFITGVVLVFTRRAGQRLERAERERDRAEFALSTINASLAQTIAERTDDLERANQALRKEIGTRRGIERALRASEAKNSALLSALPDWIFRLRIDGTILDLRCPRSQNPSGMESLQGVPDGLSDQVVGWVRQNCHLTSLETVNFRFPAEEITYEARFVPIGDVEMLAVVRDISEITRLEREVLEAHIREQRRIGEELHDGLGQQLTAVAFLIKVLELELQEQNLAQAAQAATIGKQLSAAISSIRTLARGLFRYEVGADSLISALQELTDLADKNFKVQCTLDADSTIHFSDRTADLHLYRISQEAITNAVKHGKARNIQLQLKREGTKIVFSIRDDGNGCTPQESANGIGLRTMEFRTRRLGGRFGIESHPDKGTVITCTLPDPNLNKTEQWEHTQQLSLFP